MVEETLQLLKPQIEKQRIVIQKEFQPLPPILMDREQMKQVILNLLLNAVQAMPKGGTLVLKGTLPEADQWIKLSIQDSGLGIPGEDLDKLFDPFFRQKKGESASAFPLRIGLLISIVEKLR